MRAGGVAAALAALLASRAARADPSNETLVLVGAGLALPTYALGVSLHEGSHALAAELVGASVDELHVFPPGTDPHAHVFRFGWTYVHGLRSDRAKEFFYLAPKLTDTLLLGGFAALALTGAWPRDRDSQLALTVGATGLWVDFAKDVIGFSPNDDVTKAFALFGWTGWREVPARLGYALIDVGLACVVARGYLRTFGTPADAAMPLVIPLVRTAF